MDSVHLHRLPSQPLIGPAQAKRTTLTEMSFAQHLQRAVNPLKISKHASERLAERQIDISEAEWQRITTKVQEANLKGIKDSLVILDQAALIVSAKNRTVITAMNRMEAKDQLFTNIDGTIVL